MKKYLAMCSLSLLAGAALGHLNGEYHAAASFVDDCATLRIVAFKDNDSDTRRHFHCFELDLSQQRQVPAHPAKVPVPMI